MSANLKSTDEEIVQLKKKLEALELEIQTLKKCQTGEKQDIVQENPPSFVSKEIRMTQGFQRFFEGNKNVVPMYSRYSDWYADIAQRTLENVPYILSLIHI